MAVHYVLFLPEGRPAPPYYISAENDIQRRRKIIRIIGVV
jgi:hypothetical protein